MPDFPSSAATATPLHIHNVSFYASPGMLGGFIGSTGAAVALINAVDWVANLVCYTPLALPFPYPLQRFWWYNGGTITTTNVDCGIYSVGGVKLASTGSTVMVGGTSIQYAAPTSTMILTAGSYYLAWTCDNTTQRAEAPNPITAVQGGMMGLLEETTGGFGLPATMTPVSWARTFGAEFCGITRTISGF